MPRNHRPPPFSFRPVAMAAIWAVWRCGEVEAACGEAEGGMAQRGVAALRGKWRSLGRQSEGPILGRQRGGGETPLFLFFFGFAKNFPPRLPQRVALPTFPPFFCCCLAESASLRHDGLLFFAAGGVETTAAAAEPKAADTSLRGTAIATSLHCSS